MRVSRRVLILLAALAGGLIAQSGASTPHIFYSKSFPGSVPEYFEIQLDETGKGTYRESADEDDPLRFDLSPEDTREIFGLAAKLQYFQKPLESKARMARMGMKTLRYRSGQATGEAQFNYSDNPDARAIAEWFDRMSETTRHRINLERAARFDRLGINKALLQLEASLDRNRIVAGEQLLPILGKIAGGSQYMHMAQARAAALADRIRAGKSSGR